jgi:hypothetical protein
MADDKEDSPGTKEKKEAKNWVFRNYEVQQIITVCS